MQVFTAKVRLQVTYVTLACCRCAIRSFVTHSRQQSIFTVQDITFNFYRGHGNRDSLNYVSLSLTKTFCYMCEYKIEFGFSG